MKDTRRTPNTGMSHILTDLVSTLFVRRILKHKNFSDGSVRIDVHELEFKQPHDALAKFPRFGRQAS